MYLHQDVVLEALKRLDQVHPFFGIGFLVCKQHKLPIGRKTSFGFGHAEERFLREYYHPNLASKYFFQPFRSSKKAQARWLEPKYPHAGSQSIRTRGDLAKAFIHDRNTDRWGWQTAYVDILSKKIALDGAGRVPAFWLAAWLFRNTDWPKHTTAKSVLAHLVEKFFLTKKELDQLFQQDMAGAPDLLLTAERFDDAVLLRHLEPAPDATPEEGGTLRALSLRDVGPSQSLDLNPAERLSIITGDNGLGKTFLLECVWWSLTGTWAERPALPNMQNGRRSPSISFAIAGASGNEAPQRRTLQYDWNRHFWPEPKGRPTLPGLVVYARVDGSFAVWDPVRHASTPVGQRASHTLLFRRDEVLNGLEGQIEGLLRDWVRWQNQKDQAPFKMFCSVLEKLSPPDMTPLTPGDAMRLWSDPREIPTLQHDYALVPFTNESAGVKRIVTFAYLLVWAWNEHRISSSLAKKAPQRKMVILVDEMEAHLHPKWQRVVLPALLDVTGLLSNEVEPQMIVATHSPLILASMESTFADEHDKLFHLSLHDGTSVQLEEVQFIKRGSIDAWLTSELFELRQARSREGENALEDARRLLAESSTDVALIRQVHKELKEVLPSEDVFWPRWLHFIEMKGVLL
jgi:hypothetical protein